MPSPVSTFSAIYQKSANMLMNAAGGRSTPGRQRMFLLTFAGNFIGGLVFLGFLTYRVISIPIYTALIYIHTPQFLGGEGPGELSKPLERTIHRILVLAVTSFFV